MSGVNPSKLFLPPILTNNWGRIIFISSECASLVPADMTPYSVYKAAIHAFAHGLAQMTSGTGVTVNVVMPGSTLSEGAERFISDIAAQKKISKEEAEQNFFKETRTSSLLQRFASVEEVANTITFTCSPLSGATNGACIRVDGGSIGACDKAPAQFK